MEIEVFIVPKDGEVWFTRPAPSDAPASASGENLQPAPTSVRMVPWKLKLSGLLLVCILTACGGGAYAAYKAISAMSEQSLPGRSKMTAHERNANSADAGTTQDKSRVQHLDNSRLLRRGDVVVVRQKAGANVGQIAVSANSTGVFKRGNAVEALYVLGKDRYLVTYEAGQQIVRRHDIFALVDSTSQSQH